MISTVISKSLKIFMIQVTGMILLFFANWYIVKNTSEHIYGIYSVVMNWFIIIGAITQLGMDDYHVARLPQFTLNNDNTAINKIFYWSSALVSISSLVMMLIVYLVVNYLPIPSLHKYNEYFNISILIILLQAVLGNIISFLRGLDQVVKSQVADKIIRPVLFVLLLLLLTNNQASFNRIILSQVLAVAATIVLTFFFVRILLKKSSPAHSSPVDTSLQSNFYYIIITLLQLLVTRLDILLLSIFVLPTQTGHYNIAMKFADMVAYPLFIINLIIPVYLARHHINKDRGDLYTFMQHSSRAAFLGVGALLLLLVLFGIPALGIFGKNFEGAYPVLIILAASHLVSTFKSPVNGLFIVSGKESTAMWCLFFNAVVTTVSCLVLIPIYSLNGAALAILAGNIFHTILLLVLFYKQDKIIITPFTVLYPGQRIL